MKKKLLIAVEGIDGAGKSTQIPRMAQFFDSLGCVVCTTSEPTRGRYGMEIRQAVKRWSPAKERQLFVDDRKEHLETCILPALERGEVVITDRYFYSSIAYQGTRRDAFDHNPTDEELFRLQDEIGRENRAFAPEADILVCFRLSVDEAFKRIQAGRENLEPFETRQTLTDVSRAFERVIQSHPCAIAVDASQSVDDVTAQILSGLRSYV